MDISIVITTYNYDDYLCECIDSCLSQKDNTLEYEVIVIDDGSTDQTQNILKGYSNPILKMHRINNSGIEKAANIGFERAKGNYVVRVDADDLLCSHFLREIRAYLTHDICFLYSDYQIIDEHSTILETMRLPEFDTDEIFSRGDFLATGTIYNMNTIRKQGGYSEKIRNCGLENYELILRLLQSGCKGMHLSKCLFRYRRHSENISTLKKNKIIEYGKELFFREKFGEFRTNRYHPYKLKVSSE